MLVQKEMMELKLREEKLSFSFSPGLTTSALLSTPMEETQKIVLLIHGFMSNKDSDTNLTLTKRLVEKGIATLRFDLFGHGESDGPFQKLTLSACLDQVFGMIDWIKKKGYEKIGMVGSSFGGLIAIHAASQFPLDLASLALRCPVSNYPSIWQSRLGGEGITRWKNEGVLSFIFDDKKAQLEYGYYEDLLRHDTYRAAARIKTPTLIVHGDADEDVPADQSIRLFDTLRLVNDKKQLNLMPGADHGFSKETDFEKMIQQILSWITRSM